MRNKKYQIIYADPPWQYNRKAGQGIAADHYPTMSLQEICDLPVGKLADKDCVLFLWVTFPQLREGLSDSSMGISIQDSSVRVGKEE